MMGKGMEQTRKPTLPTVPPARFLQEVIAELKKVTWPTRNETMKLTAVVIAISVIVGLFIGGLDALFVAIQGVIFK
jgi:preprotein translocase subunit SecE